MKRLLVFIFLLNFVSVSICQTENRKVYSDSISELKPNCFYLASWPIIDWSGLDSNIMITYYNIPPCKKSDCSIYVAPECKAQEYSFIVYNRWGEIQFETTTPGNSWYAYESADGGYVWQIQGTYISGEEFKFRGHFYLMKDIE